MPTPSLHREYKIKCPKDVDPDQMNPECFQDFIPQNVTVIEVKGLTLKQEKMPCRWEITVQLQGDSEVVYNDNEKRYNVRKQININKPRNTNLLNARKGVRNGECYWIFEYEVECSCSLS